MGGADRMTNTTHFVGLDVHARQTHTGILDRETGQLRRRLTRSQPLRSSTRISCLGLTAGSLALTR
jgi:hypothetical protein